LRSWRSTTSPDTRTLAHLLSYDSTFGRLDAEVGYDRSSITVDGRPIRATAERDPAKLEWGDLGVDIVIESTGRFRSREMAALHLKAGASVVIISAPGKGEDATIVIGINETIYDPLAHDVISAASCTTNCVVPMVKILHDTFGIERGFITSVHAYAADQVLLDYPHKDLRRARSAAVNIIPTTTGAARAAALVIPELQGRLDGVALRVPVEDASLTDLAVVLTHAAGAEEINQAFKAAADGPLHHILREANVLHGTDRRWVVKGDRGPWRGTFPARKLRTRDQQSTGLGAAGTGVRAFARGGAIMVDLQTRYLGLELRSPLVASASPMTGSLRDLRRLEEAGAGAVVLPSLFQEQLTEEARVLEQVAGGRFGRQASTWSLARLHRYNTGPDGYLTLIHEAKAALHIPVIASLNAVDSGTWIDYVPLLEKAGADAVELNVYFVATHLGLPGREIETRCTTLVRSAREQLGIPLAVKLSPYFNALGNIALQLIDAGADGLVLFNRFYQPEIDLDTLKVQPKLDLSSPADLRLPLRWIGILHGQLPASLAASGGVHSGLDAVKALLAGADVAMTTSALLRYGPEHLAAMEAELRQWLTSKGYESVADIRGVASRQSASDSDAYERANYIRTLVAISPTRQPS
jgi:glyceraldehyde-3-phosphate dehydrogenase type I